MSMDIQKIKNVGWAFKHSILIIAYTYLNSYYKENAHYSAYDRDNRDNLDKIVLLYTIINNLKIG